MNSSDIKINFQNWLISKGCRNKTDKNRPSTVYEYTKRIDRLCDGLYGTHNAQNWEKLATEIGSALVSYYECNNKEYFIDRYNITEALLYFDDITKSNRNAEYPQTKLSIIYGSNEYVISTIPFYKLEDYLRTYDFVLDELQKHQNPNIESILNLYIIYNSSTSNIVRNFSRVCDLSNHLSFFDSVIHLEYNSKNNAKTKLALDKYYEFLQNPSNDPILARLKTERHDDKIKLCLAKIKSIPDDLMKCITVAEKTGATPLQIKSHFSSGTLMATEVSNVLRIDEKTLWKLKKEKILIPKHTQPLAFSEDNINEYLKNHFHIARIKYPNIDYYKTGEKFWCNRKNAAVIMQRSERTVFNYTSKGLLTYTNYSPQAPRYYIPELQYLGSLK